ncbi:hypothetical protein [Raoultella sp. T31]
MTALTKKEIDLLFKLSENAGIEVWEMETLIIQNYLQDLIERLEAE